FDAIDDKAKGVTTQIKMYDSLGNQYSMEIYLVYNPHKDPIDGVPSGWSIYNQKSDTAPKFSNGDIVLTDKDGNKVTTTVEFPDVNFIYDQTGKEPEIKEPVPPAKITIPTITGLPNGAVLGDGTNGIQLEVGNLTQYASKTKLESKPVDGKPAGQMQGYDVGADGKIIAYYNNGSTRVLGQIVVADFANPAGLEKVGDNLFKTTANSGDFDSIGNAGNFQSGVLEMSNVDLSLEFTEMIVTQRGFQANSRIISVSDEMLQEVVNIKR
ncbi:MAG: flagellar hook-basal body complex protein, partial [Cellulosilyticaceae bacterium]